jgi:hypothetical protein
MNLAIYSTSKERKGERSMKIDDKRLKRAFDEDEEAYKERVEKLEKTAPDITKAGSDAELPFHQQNREAKKNDHISQKTYMFPESYNALRRELEEYWYDFFVTPNPLTGTSPAWCMVFDAPQFVGYLNGFTGLAVQFDSESVDAICSTFLNALRRQRGVSEIH